MSTLMTDRLPRHRITVEEYYRMAEVGLIEPDARVELIEGEIIEMAAMGSLHGGAVTQLTRIFSRAVGDQAQLRVQLPIRLGAYSEPEPDLAVVMARADFYKKSHPGPADALLLVEVGESSSNRDRGVKIPLYARHAVPEVWLVDLETNRVHFYRAPRDGDYTDVSFTANPGVVAVSALPYMTVDLSDLFG
jgi:Uma2 family endonuclease